MTAIRALLLACAIALVCLAAILPAGVSLAVAQTEATDGEEESIPARLDRWESEAVNIELRLEYQEPTIDAINAMRATLEDQISGVAPTREAIEAELAPLREQREALGEAPEDSASEAPQIAEERKRLGKDIAALEAQLKRAQQAEARARGLIDRLAHLRRELFTARLKSRGPSLLEPGVPRAAVTALSRVANTITLETGARIEKQSMGASLLAGLVLPLVLIALAGFTLFGVKGFALDRLLARITPETPHSRRVAAGACVTLARLLLPAVALALLFGGIANSGLLGGRGMMLLTGLAEAAAVVIGAYALGGAFFAPRAPLLRLSILKETDAVAAHRWLILLACVVGFDRALVLKGQQMGVAVEGLALLNTILLALGGVIVWRLVGYIRPPPRPSWETPHHGQAEDETSEAAEAPPPAPTLARNSVNAVRTLCRIVAVVAPLLAVAGYYAAARYIFFPTVFSGAVIGGCILLYHVARAIVDQSAGDESGAETERLRLIPTLGGLLLALGALPVLALIWGADPADLSRMGATIIEGFQIGEVVISPVDFGIFAIVIIIGYIITRRLQWVLRRNVLPFTGLDSGGRDAIAAGAGHLGLIISALIAISATGVDLSNLAIVAGALSVGIGFGLQNIVNNFVSGIILLVERPIKAGDWVELPAGMGYVKKINVRSTEIETFDRASLFVPNAQLISENVINWTHSNLNGRIILKVNVDYSSDLRQVERILLEVARGHPLMLRRPAPYVLFRGYGSDALEFEIRGILRDINWILNVQSDLNFEISRRFAEEGIEVPFRQADIEIKNMDQILAALRARGTLHELPADEPVEEAGPPEPDTGSSPPKPPRPRRKAVPTRPGDDTAGPDGESG